MEYEKPTLMDANDLTGDSELPSVAPMAVIIIFLVAAFIYTVAAAITVVGAAAVELVGFATTVASTKTTVVNS